MIKSPAKKESLQSLIKEADAWFSKYIRILYADSSGMVTCSCGCGKRLFWTQMQASHFINRSNMATRYEFYNVVPATRECNYYDPEHSEKIGLFIANKFGYQTATNLQFSRSTTKFTRPELEEIINTYKTKFQELKKSKGL